MRFKANTVPPDSLTCLGLPYARRCLPSIRGRGVMCRSQRRSTIVRWCSVGSKPSCR
jgi:hypothetical protein